MKSREDRPVTSGVVARQFTRIAIDRFSFSPSARDHAIEVMQRGGVVAFPTDTIYGLVAPATADGCRLLQSAKGRAARKPFVVALVDLPRPGGWIESVSLLVRRRMEILWPQPVAVLLPAGPMVPEQLVGEGGKVGLRRAADPLTQALAAAAGGGVISTSANLAGKSGAHDADAIAADLGGAIDLLLDGGALHSDAKPTSIVDVTVTPPRILRIGRCPLARIRELLRERVVLA